jgi:PAS domain S-box-containing protein
MQYSYSPYILPLIFVAGIAFSITIYAWRRRFVNGATALALMALSMALWSLFYALEIAGADLKTKFFWGIAQYAGIPFAPYFWLVFAINYGNYTNNWLQRFVTWGVILPFTTFLLAVTTQWHGLIWSEYSVTQQGAYSAISAVHGVWFWVHSAFSYLLLLAGSIVLTRTLFRNQSMYRGQVIAMIVALLAPWASNILFLTGNSPVPYLDPTPFAFTVSMVAITWAIFGFRLVNIAPIARDLILDSMRDGMIVLDVRKNIVDINQSAARIIGVPVESALGRNMDDVLVRWGHIVRRIHEDPEEWTDSLVTGSGASYQQYELRFAPFEDAQNQALGHVLILRLIVDDPILQLRSRSSNSQPAPSPQIQEQPSLKEETGDSSILNFLKRIIIVSTKTDLVIPPNVKPSWHQALERAFTIILRIIALVGTALLVILGTGLSQYQLVFISYTGIILFLWLLGGVRNISFGIRTTLFLYLIYGLGVVEIVNFGYSVEGFVFFMSLVVSATILRGRTGGIWMWSISLGTMGFLGWLIGLRTLVPFSVNEAQVIPHSVSAALSSLFVFGAGTGAMSAAITVLLENLNRAWNQEMQASNLLQQERDLLEQRVEERTRELLDARDEALKASKNLRRYYRAIEQSGSSIVITDIKGNIEYANPQFERSTGYAVEKVLGKNPRFLKSGRQTTEYYKKLWDTISSGEIWHGEFLNRHKNGTLFWEFATIAPVIDSSGKIMNYVAIKENISERKRVEDELRKLSRAVEQSGNTVIIHNKQGEIEYVNPKFTEITGYAFEEALGKKPGDLMQGSESTQPHETQDWWMTVQTGRTWHGEFHNKRKDGSEFWEYATITPVYDQDGIISNFVEIKQDVTEEKLLQESLRRSHEQQQVIDSLLRISLEGRPTNDLLEDIIDQLLSISWMKLTPKGGIFLMDEKSRKLHLHTHRNLAPELQVKCAQIVPGQCLCGLAALKKEIQFSDCLDDRHDIRYEGIEEHGHYNIPILQGDHILGVIVLYLPHGYKKIKEDEPFLRAVADAVSGILSRKRAEESLLESEARFRQLVENASDMIYRTDLKGKFTYANPSALNMMGYASEEDVLGKSYLELTTPEFRHKMKRIYDRQALSRTMNTYYEFPAITVNGHIVWVGQNVQLIMEGEEIIGFQAVGRDITALKQAKDALALSRDQALDASRFKSQLLSRVSHELRTPLGGVLGYAELLQYKMFGELNDKQVEALGNVVESTRYLTNIVNDLLDEAQIESQSVTLHYDNFKTADLLERVTDTMQVLANKKGLEFEAFIASDLPEKLRGDFKRLQQILFNLTGNAIKFTTTGKVHILLSASSPTKWCMEVSDTGAGIPVEEQQNIFEPFRQVSNALTRENRGSGLGLAISKQLIELMGGKIALKSEVGVGSTFTVTLPIIQSEEPA